MKVILMSDLRHRGRRGQVVEVKPGFARNFLLPQGLALLASPGNIKRFEHEKKKTFFRRKKVCRFTVEHIEYIDYKDVKLLQQYILERAKILPRRISGNSARHQRMVQAAIKRARHLALIPYTTD